MPRTKPTAIVSALQDPRPLCCQHCFADSSLIPLGAHVEPVFGPMGLHLGLMHLESSHEFPRDHAEGKGLLVLDLRCRNKACGKLTILAITAGDNGTFLQLIGADEDAEEPEPDDSSC